MDFKELKIRLELVSLQETEGIVEYHSNFEQISSRGTLPEDYLVHSFLAGLQHDTQRNVRMFQPRSVRQCFLIGKMYEIAYPMERSDAKDQHGAPTILQRTSHGLSLGDLGQATEPGTSIVRSETSSTISELKLQNITFDAVDASEVHPDILTSRPHENSTEGFVHFKAFSPSKIEKLTSLEYAKTEETQSSSPTSVASANLFITGEEINALISSRPIEHSCETSVNQEQDLSIEPDVSSPPSTFAATAFNQGRKTVNLLGIFQNRVVHDSGIQLLCAYHLFDEMSRRALEVFRPSKVTFASNLIGSDIASAEMCVRYVKLDVYLHNTPVNGLWMHIGRDTYESSCIGVSGCVQFDPGGLDSLDFLLHLYGLEVFVEMPHRDILSHKGVCGVPWDPGGNLKLSVAGGCAVYELSVFQRVHYIAKSVVAEFFIEFMCQLCCLLGSV